MNTRKESQENRDQAEKMRKSHLEQERTGTKWRPGMREGRHERMQERAGKARQGRRRNSQSEKLMENGTGDPAVPTVSSAENKKLMPPTILRQEQPSAALQQCK